MTRNKPEISASVRYFVVAAVVAATFLSAYSFAEYRARSGASSVAVAEAATVSAPQSPAGTGCACCGGGPTAKTGATAKLAGDVQRVTVSTRSGSFSPNEITVKAGVPVEITFEEGQGCLAQVVFEQFGITKDLTHGGAVVKLPALKPGTYSFACGMAMQFGSVTAR